MAQASSWGRYPRVPAAAREFVLRDRHMPLPDAPLPMLAHGNGRSYGDSCLNPGGTLLRTRGLDRFIGFDRDSGVLECEAGALLADILEVALPTGWFLPVTPGTRFVTVGGAIANDVHGKNHHHAGTFGRHVLGFELLRSDGTRLECTPRHNAGLFAATIGGLGLTGLVVRARLQLRRVPGPWLSVETQRFDGLADFFALSASHAGSEYSVAWVDCLARGANLGRGVFMHADHADAGDGRVPPAKPPRPLPFPPLPLVNRLSLRAMNEAYYRRAPGTPTRRQAHYVPFFYPLDAIANWNRAYGPKGFVQYQCVVPPAQAEAATRELLERIARARRGSFLVVLKQFGDAASPGLLSFPRAGTTLALDFPMAGDGTLALLDELDTVVFAAGGALYPAKDARMGARAFEASFPRLPEFKDHLDPGFSSGFWRRVTEAA